MNLQPTSEFAVGHDSFLPSVEVAAPRRETQRRRALAAADVLALLLAYGVVWIVAPPPNTLLHDAVLLAVLPAWVLMNKLLRLYDRDASLIHKSTLNEWPAIVQSISFGCALEFIFVPVLPGASIHRDQLIVFWFAAVLITPALRTGARNLVRRMTPPERLLIIGSGMVASLVSRKIRAHPEYGSEVVGFVDASDHGNDHGDGLAMLGGEDEFARICREHDVERVVIAFSSLDHEPLLDLIRIATQLRLRVSVVPRLFEVIGHGVEIDQIEGMSIMGLRGASRTRSTKHLKRALDICASAGGLLILSPLFALIAIAIRLGSEGPVFFRQERAGLGDSLFSIIKFRTMVNGADQMKSDLLHLNEMEGGGLFKIRDDPRVTRLGQILRRTSLDELPQLWNVLRGDMSLVGPRPLVPNENDQVMGWHRQRLALKPGLTGPWQVMGRNAIPFEEMVKLDYLYVTDWSLWNDLKLIARTLPAVVGRTGH